MSVPHVDVQDIVPPDKDEIAEVIQVTPEIQQMRERIAKLTVDTTVLLARRRHGGDKEDQGVPVL